jgi:hypothetical protein
MGKGFAVRHCAASILRLRVAGCLEFNAEYEREMARRVLL